MRIESDRYVVYLPTGDLTVARSEDEARRILTAVTAQHQRETRHKTAVGLGCVALVVVAVAVIAGWL